MNLQSEQHSCTMETALMIGYLHMGALDILVTAIMLKIIHGGWCNMLMV